MTSSLKIFSNLTLRQLLKPSLANGSLDYFVSKFSSKSTPTKCDVCIIGGGAMGTTTAYWLKQHPKGKNLNVVVLEKDPTYEKASTTLSMGGIRQQFTNSENIQMSLSSAQFIKNIDEHLRVPGQDPIDIEYKPHGYLFIATTPEGAETLQENYRLQTSLGSKVQLMSAENVKQKYPYLNVHDIVLASFGTDNEGWFDPWSFLSAFKRKAISLGTTYVKGEVVGFGTVTGGGSSGPKDVQFKDDAGNVRTLQFDQCLIAAGFNSGKVSKMAGIGLGQGALSVAVPVEPRKRYVYLADAPDLRKSVNTAAHIIDSSGLWIRPDTASKGFFTGRSPTEEQEPPADNWDVDHTFFEDFVWPELANRSKAYENIKIKSSYVGFYDYNAFDQNGIIGTHPVFSNFHFATGFSGHGIQQSTAVGRAIMEVLLEGGFKTIDLTRFGFERVIQQEKVLEKNII